MFRTATGTVYAFSAFGTDAGGHLNTVPIQIYTVSPPNGSSSVDTSVEGRRSVPADPITKVWFTLRTLKVLMAECGSSTRYLAARLHPAETSGSSAPTLPTGNESDWRTSHDWLHLNRGQLGRHR